MLDFIKRMFGHAPEPEIAAVSSGRRVPQPREPLTRTPEPVQQACPYCGVALTKMPTRKTRCKVCREYMYVKGRPSDRTKRLLTEAQKAEVDEEWERHYSRNRVLRVLEGGSDREFDEMKAAMPGASDAEVGVEVLRNRLERTHDTHMKKMALFSMARLRFDNGGEYEDLLRESRKMELQEHAEHDFVRKVQINAYGCCEVCEKMEGKKLTLNTALKTLPLPVKGCTRHADEDGRGWCLCWYSAVTDDHTY